MVHAGAVTRLRHVGYAAIALALPYTLLAGALAVASRTAQAAPSLWQAVVASFLLAVVAGGLGAARGLAPWSRLARLMPARPRSVILGMLGALALLTAVGAALAGASLAVHLPEVKAATNALAPGPAGAALLLLAQLAYAPNAIIWAVAYVLGPGFAFGTGTVVAPTGSALGALPAFPMLAALPSGAKSAGPAWVTVLVLATPYLAGRVRGDRDGPDHAHAGDRGGRAVGLHGGRGHGRCGRPGGGVLRRPARRRPPGHGRPVRMAGRPGGHAGNRRDRRADRRGRELADVPPEDPGKPPRRGSARPSRAGLQRTGSGSA